MGKDEAIDRFASRYASYLEEARWPQDVARVIAFLASYASRHVTSANPRGPVSTPTRVAWGGPTRRCSTGWTPPSPRDPDPAHHRTRQPGNVTSEPSMLSKGETDE